MSKPRPHFLRLLAVSPSTRGFGYAVMEGEGTLVDWGVKRIEGKKNVQSLKRLEELILQYGPDTLVMPDYKESRRATRILVLGKKITALAEKHKIRVSLLSHKEVRRAFFADGMGTKYAVAEILAKQFPDELGFRLPPKRRAWTSEDARMDIFDAVAPCVALRVKGERWAQKQIESKRHR